MWNKEEHILKMKPVVDKLLATLKKKNIEFEPTDNELANVIFKLDNKIIKISHHSFYRFSGISTLITENDQKMIQIVKVTDEMFLNNYMKPIIELLLSK